MRWGHKFHAVPTEADGIKFASKAEARYYQFLKARVAAGEVVFFLRQVPFHLPGGVKYVADFLTFDADGSCHVIDVKGMETAAFKAKRKQVEAMYPVKIEVVSG
jgi:hypothetical protein